MAGFGRSSYHHLLVVEDDRPTSRLMEVLLTRRGFQVTCAYDGVEAIEKIGENDFDLIFLDLMLPRLDGLGVLKRVRANPATENLPVVIVTAKTEQRDIFEGYSAGADMYLTKPFNPAELITFMGG